MYLHPIFVHFPIALLTIYAVLELIRSEKVTSKPYWFHAKALFAIFGALGALAAYLTGPEQAEAVPLGAMHANFGLATLVVFGIVGLSYLLEWFMPTKYSLFVMRPYIIMPLAVAGLILVTITGGLGGALVYGTNFDPLMAPIFKILGVY